MSLLVLALSSTFLGFLSITFFGRGHPDNRGPTVLFENVCVLQDMYLPYLMALPISRGVIISNVKLF